MFNLVSGSLRSVLITALDLAHVHAASGACQQRPVYFSSISFATNSLWGGAPRRLSHHKENPKQIKEMRKRCICTYCANLPTHRHEWATLAASGFYAVAAAPAAFFPEKPPSVPGSWRRAGI